VLRLYAARKNGVKVTRHMFDNIFLIAVSFSLLAFRSSLLACTFVSAESWLTKIWEELTVFVLNFAKS
jgi:hypothetical protein